MNTILNSIHNFIHNVAIKVDSWIVANPKYSLWGSIFLAGIIIGALLF